MKKTNAQYPYVVYLPTRDWHGTLVGRFIFTAAQPFNVDWSGRRTIEEWCGTVETVRTYKGTFRAAVIYVDPICDIAVLGEPDSELTLKNWTAYNTFCQETKGLTLGQIENTPLGEVSPGIPVCVCNSNFRWIRGRAKRPGRSWEYFI